MSFSIIKRNNTCLIIGANLIYRVESLNEFSSSSPQEITIDVTHIVPTFNLWFTDGTGTQKDFYTVADRIWAVVDYNFIPTNISNQFSINFIGNGWTSTSGLDQLGYLAWDSGAQIGWSDGNDGSYEAPVVDGKWYCPTPVGRWVYGNDVELDKEFDSKKNSKIREEIVTKIADGSLFEFMSDNFKLIYHFPMNCFLIYYLH